MSTISETQPEWQPDSETKTCTLCARKFTFWFRRHHCRKCGKVVCHLCSFTRTTYELKTPIVEAPGQIFGETTDMPHRTCDLCVEDIIANTIIRESTITEGEAAARLETPIQIPSIVAKRRSRYIKDQTRQQTLDMSINSHSEEEDDNDRCPVCFTMIKDLDESLREEHINTCLVNLEFRGSPETHNRVANRMLVYIVPGNGQSEPLRQILPVQGSSSSEALIDSTIASSFSELPIDPQPEKSALEPIAAEECVICLEEFEAGDKVGRLECLCAFHYDCIKGWFKKKGPGDCPIHAIHLL